MFSSKVTCQRVNNYLYFVVNYCINSKNLRNFNGGRRKVPVIVCIFYDFLYLFYMIDVYTLNTQKMLNH